MGNYHSLPKNHVNPRYDPDENSKVDHADLENILTGQHHTKTENIPGWELIDSYEDTDTGTAFDYDSGVVTVYSMYMVVLSLQAQLGDGYTGDLEMRVNAQDTADYRSQQYMSGTGSTTTGQTSWIPEINLDRPIQAVLYFRGGNLAASATHVYPSFFGVISEGYGGTVLTGGDLAVDFADVDQIRVYTSPVATGRLKLYGLNL